MSVLRLPERARFTTEEVTGCAMAVNHTYDVIAIAFLPLKEDNLTIALAHMSTCVDEFDPDDLGRVYHADIRKKFAFNYTFSLPHTDKTPDERAQLAAAVSLTWHPTDNILAVVFPGHFTVYHVYALGAGDFALSASLDLHDRHETTTALWGSAGILLNVAEGTVWVHEFSETEVITQQVQIAEDSLFITACWSPSGHNIALLCESGEVLILQQSEVNNAKTTVMATIPAPAAPHSSDLKIKTISWPCSDWLFVNTDTDRYLYKITGNDTKNSHLSVSATAHQVFHHFAPESFETPKLYQLWDPHHKVILENIGVEADLKIRLAVLLPNGQWDDDIVDRESETDAALPTTEDFDQQSVVNMDWCKCSLSAIPPINPQDPQRPAALSVLVYTDYGELCAFSLFDELELTTRHPWVRPKPQELPQAPTTVGMGHDPSGGPANGDPIFPRKPSHLVNGEIRSGGAPIITTNTLPLSNNQSEGDNRNDNNPPATRADQHSNNQLGLEGFPKAADSAANSAVSLPALPGGTSGTWPPSLFPTPKDNTPSSSLFGGQVGICNPSVFSSTVAPAENPFGSASTATANIFGNPQATANSSSSTSSTAATGFSFAAAATSTVPRTPIFNQTGEYDTQTVDITPMFASKTSPPSNSATTTSSPPTSTTSAHTPLPNSGRSSTPTIASSSAFMPPPVAPTAASPIPTRGVQQGSSNTCTPDAHQSTLGGSSGFTSTMLAHPSSQQGASHNPLGMPPKSSGSDVDHLEIPPEFYTPGNPAQDRPSTTTTTTTSLTNNHTTQQQLPAPIPAGGGTDSQPSITKVTTPTTPNNKNTPVSFNISPPKAKSKGISQPPTIAPQQPKDPKIAPIPKTKDDTQKTQKKEPQNQLIKDEPDFGTLPLPQNMSNYRVVQDQFKQFVDHIQKASSLLSDMNKRFNKEEDAINIDLLADSCNHLRQTAKEMSDKTQQLQDEYKKVLSGWRAAKSGGKVAQQQQHQDHVLEDLPTLLFGIEQEKSLQAKVSQLKKQMMYITAELDYVQNQHMEQQHQLVQLECMETDVVVHHATSSNQYTSPSSPIEVLDGTLPQWLDHHDFEVVQQTYPRDETIEAPYNHSSEYQQQTVQRLAIKKYRKEKQDKLLADYTKLLQAVQECYQVASIISEASNTKTQIEAAAPLVPMAVTSPSFTLNGPTMDSNATNTTTTTTSSLQSQLAGYGFQLRPSTAGGKLMERLLGNTKATDTSLITKDTTTSVGSSSVSSIEEQPKVVYKKVVPRVYSVSNQKELDQWYIDERKISAATLESDDDEQDNVSATSVDDLIVNTAKRMMAAAQAKAAASKSSSSSSSGSSNIPQLGNTTTGRGLPADYFNTEGPSSSLSSSSTNAMTALECTTKVNTTSNKRGASSPLSGDGGATSGLGFDLGISGNSKIDPNGGPPISFPLNSKGLKIKPPKGKSSNSTSNKTATVSIPSPPVAPQSTPQQQSPPLISTTEPSPTTTATFPQPAQGAALNPFGAFQVETTATQSKSPFPATEKTPQDNKANTTAASAFSFAQQASSSSSSAGSAFSLSGLGAALAGSSSSSSSSCSPFGLPSSAALSTTPSPFPSTNSSSSSSSPFSFAQATPSSGSSSSFFKQTASSIGFVKPKSEQPTSAFGTPATSSSTTSPFANTSAPSVFGGTPFANAPSGQSPFGNNAASTTANPFSGTTSAFGTGGTGASSSSSFSAFGNTSSSACSPFATTTDTQQGGAGAPMANPFASLGSSGGAPTQPSIFGGGSAFGGGGGGGSSSVFGGSSSTTSPPPFSTNTATTGSVPNPFGNPQSGFNTATQSPFTSGASAFGQSSQLGNSSPFASAAAVSSSSPFGSASPFNTSQQGGFAALASGAGGSAFGTPTAQKSAFPAMGGSQWNTPRK